VNSIKTARRVDGLLRALGLNSRTIHAQLQQKQRLKALETFSSCTQGVLVATDVAARGLDVPRIASVLHYDVARSPQVHLHRAGRTARAGETGLSVSLVAPEDGAHHEAVCGFLGTASMPPLRLDSSVLPALAQRVALAKKVWGCSVDSF
jgi:ATP-dependent RNA helicase DDX24/MAK5